MPPSAENAHPEVIVDSRSVFEFFYVSLKTNDKFYAFSKL